MDAEKVDEFLQIAEQLENKGFLDRGVESFPSGKEILARPGRTITRPELAVLMASSKKFLTQQMEGQADFLQDECCACYLVSYFPIQIQEQYRQSLAAHPLANAITATVISNKIINQAGCGFLSLLDDNEHSNILDSVSCYLTFDSALEGNALRQAIHSLDNQITADKQCQLLLELEDILADFCSWTMAQGQKIRPDGQSIAWYKGHLNDYKRYFLRCNIETESYQTQLLQYLQEGIPDELAQQVLFIASLKDFPFIVSLATEMQKDVATVLQWLDDVTNFLGLPAIYAQMAKLPKHGYWQRLVTAQIKNDIQHSIGLLIQDILRTKSASCADYFEAPAEKLKIDRYNPVYQEVMATLPVNLLPYIILTKALQRMVISKGNPEQVLRQAQDER
jgi:glutamate dehydrogenase